MNYGWIKNTCAIRMSRALNYSGHEIPNNDNLRTVPGGDNKRYAFRVQELREYLINQFSIPHHTYNNPDLKSIIPQEFIGTKGIIVFTVDSWSDATGHFTLWDGSNCIDGTNYWGKASKVEIWIAN